MIGRNVLIPGIMPEADIRWAAARLQVRAAGAPASQEEFTILQRNGGRAFVETYSEIVTIDGEKVMLLCIRDITSRKMAQQERQNQLDRAHQTMNNPQIVALGAETHSDYVRRIAAGTDFTVRDARTIEEFMDLIRDNACDVLLAEFPMADIGGEDLLTITRDTCADCMTIFRVPSSSVADAVQLVRLGAYSCIDEETPDSEVLQMLDRAMGEVESRQASRESRDQGWRRMLVGESPEMNDVARIIQLVAMRRCTG